MLTSRKTDFLNKNNFSGIDISWPMPSMSLNVPQCPSMSLDMRCPSMSLNVPRCPSLSPHLLSVYDNGAIW